MHMYFNSFIIVIALEFNCTFIHNRKGNVQHFEIK